MKNMVRQLIAVTFGLCLSMFFSICSFASTGYPWFQVPNNNTPYSCELYWYDSNATRYTSLASISSGGVVYIAKPSNFDSTYSSQYGCRVIFRLSNKGAGYYGITLSDSSVRFIDSDPGASVSPVCWASKGYGSSHKYSLQTNYLDQSGIVRLGQIAIYHPSGDGGTQITSSDFPITFKVAGYTGQFNYAGIPDDGVYNPTTINSNKANTAIELTGELSEDVQILSTEVSTLESDLSDIGSKLVSSIEWIERNLTYYYLYTNNVAWSDSQGKSHSYYSYKRRTYNIVNEKVTYTETQYYGTFIAILFDRLDKFIEYLSKLFDVVWEWWYPLKSSTPQYWNVYNTDTDDTELVNPSTVTYYITWYLGQLFLMNNDDTPLGDLQDHVDDIKDQFETVESQEQSIIDSIDDSFSTFMPDLSQIGSFRALSWCSNYLQQIYVSLGAYGTVILIGLLLGVCMQFIGYFRYK